MNALIEMIKKIGIFMIAAQALIHFAPGQKYEKYMKLIVGVVILFQFLKPVYGFFTGTAIDWDDWNAQAFQSGYEEAAGELAGRAPESISSSNSIEDSVIMRIEEEIKSRLNREMENETYCVDNVRVSMKTLPGTEAGGTKQYELVKIRVVVRQSHVLTNNGRDGSDGSDNSSNSNSMYVEPVEKVSISPISIDINSTDAGMDEETEGSGGKERIKGIEEEKEEREAAVEEALLKRFCSVLGMDEEHMEVSVYGIGDENTGQDNG